MKMKKTENFMKALGVPVPSYEQAMKRLEETKAKREKDCRCCQRKFKLSQLEKIGEFFYCQFCTGSFIDDDE